VVTAIQGQGTTEQQWLPFLEALDLPELSLDPLPTRVTVVAPHPDDEVLGCGGLISMLGALGVPVDLVAVTDGEASNPGGSVTPADLAVLRRQETGAALAQLCVPDRVCYLGLPDGAAGRLQTPVLEALRCPRDSWLIGPWSGDGHPDHEAVGRACEVVAERDGARLLSYPIWAWHWAAPHTEQVPWARARRISLPLPTQAAKARAVGCFTSQIAPLGPLPADSPVLPPWVLDRFTRPSEVVLT